VGNLPVANLIREGKTFQLPMTMQIGRAQGMVLMDDYLTELFKQGLINESDYQSRLIGKGADQAKSGAK
jgi:twitching motility protein PilT